MKTQLFINNKNIYKANLHCHTTVSDGKLSPQEIKEAYKAKGYSIIAFTDHDNLVNQSHLNDDNFLAISSCEVGLSAPEEFGQRGKNKCYHLNLYSLDPNASQTPPLMQMDYFDIDAINQYIKDRNDEGYLVCYNHPYWSLQTYEDYSPLKGCFAMEIYNNGCEVSDGYFGYNPQVYDEMLRQDNKLFCLSTDDNHNGHPDGTLSDSFGGFVMINCDSLDYSSVMDALVQGDFYSSQEPEIFEISMEDGTLNIKCSDVNLIVVYTDGRKCYVKKGESINEASFELKGDEKYIRVMCRDKDHKDANSNAYWIES